MKHDFTMPQPPHFPEQEALPLAGQHHLTRLFTKREQALLAGLRRQGAHVSWQVYAVKRTLKVLMRDGAWFATVTAGDHPGYERTRARFEDMLVRTMSLAWFIGMDANDLSQFFTRNVTAVFRDPVRARKAHQALVHGPRLNKAMAHFVFWVGRASFALSSGYDGSKLQRSGFYAPLKTMLTSLRETACELSYGQEGYEALMERLLKEFYGVR